MVSRFWAVEDTKARPQNVERKLGNSYKGQVVVEQRERKAHLGVEKTQEDRVEQGFQVRAGLFHNSAFSFTLLAYAFHRQHSPTLCW